LLLYRYPERCAEIVEAAARERDTVAAEARLERKERVYLTIRQCLSAGVYPADRHLRATGRP